MKPKKYNIWIITTLVSFILIFISLISIKNAPTRGYETSIYLATPLIFWIAMAGGIFNGVYLIIYNIYDEKRKIWMVGFFEILFCRYLLLILYNLRGYLYLDRGDAFSYVGKITDVSVYGAINENFYPIVSILGSEISQITNIPSLTASYYLPTFFYITYQLSIYCWAKLLFPSKKFILCTVISSIPFFFAYFSTTIYHMALAAYTLPLFCYVLKRRTDSRFIFLEVILLLMYPFIHPIISFFVLVYLIGLLVSEYAYNINLKKISLNLFLIGSISLVSWFFFQKTLFKESSLVLLQLLNVYNTETTLVLTQRYVVNLWDINTLKHLLVPFYDDFIYCTLFLISTYVIILKDNIFNKKIFFETILNFIFGNLVLVVLYLNSNVHNPVRLSILNQNLLFTLPIIGYLLYYFQNNKANSKFLIVICLILVSQLASMLSIYQSSIVFLPNDQTTRSEVTGMDWLISTKNTNFSNLDIMSPVYRYSDLVYGTIYTSSRTDLRDRDLTLSNHFGISNNSSNDLIFPVNEDQYLVITTYDIQAYTNTWKTINRFNKEDFDKVNSCENVDKIYSNEAITINLIHKVMG